MQQPGPAAKGNRVRQLRISCGSSPLTQPLISLQQMQSSYLYLPGISVLRAGRGEVGGWVCLSSEQRAELPLSPPRFSGTLHTSWTSKTSSPVKGGRFVSFKTHRGTYTEYTLALHSAPCLLP